MKIPNNPDFYTDFYNLLTDSEKDLFYIKMGVNSDDLDNLKPDKIFESYCINNNVDKNKLLKEYIFRYCISSRIEEALKKTLC